MSTATAEKAPTRQDWLEVRKSGIGGSDVAGVLGVSQWKTPLDVYRDKTGEAEEQEESEAMRWGALLEGLVAEEFARRQNVKVQRRNQLYRDSEYPFLIANIDRHIVGSKDILECKTTSGWNRNQWGEEGTDQVPFPYLCQVQHYMMVLDRQRAWIAVLIDGRDFRIYCVDRNEKLIGIIRDRCRKFWNEHVLAGVPPEPTTKQDIETLYKAGGHEGIVTAAPDVEEEARSLAGLKQQKKELDKEIEAHENEIKKAIGEAAELVRASDGKTIATWKSTTSKRFDGKAFEADYPDLYEQYKKENTSRRFLVKEKNLVESE